MDLNLQCADALDYLATLADDSVDLIATDPPYFKVKDLPWDNAWKNERSFISWLERVVIEFARVLKPTGSMYLFTNPYLGGEIEHMASRHFKVLNHLIWRKPSGKWGHCHKESLRKYFPQTERIIFAESLKSNGFAYEPIYQYMKQALEGSRLTQAQINKKLGNKMAGHWFGKSQFTIPSAQNYAALQDLLPKLNMSYQDLYRWYADLRASKARRFFAVSKEVPFTDVWDFKCVQYYPGKHPCEKPPLMMEHIIASSSQPGDLVIDPFMGSGATAKAAVKLGRRFGGCDLDQHWVKTLEIDLSR